MTPQANRLVVERWVRAGDERDLDVFDDLFTPDTVDHVSGNTGVGWWKEIYRKIVATFPDGRWTDVLVIAETDHAVFQGTMTGTHRGSQLPFLRDIPPTGRVVAWKHHHVFRFDGGRIAEHWATRDDLGVLRLLSPGALGPRHCAAGAPVAGLYS